MNIEQDIDFELARLRRLAQRMDALFTIPGTRITVGLDNIVGLVPVFGDLAALLPGLWMIGRARRLGASPGVLVYMVLNSLADFAVGLVPIAGDLFDLLYDANMRNYKALEVNLNKRAARAQTVHDRTRGLDGPLFGGTNPALLD